MKIALAQINVVVGDLAGNADRIIAQARAAHAAGVDLLVTPELALCGYPPEDLLLRPAFLAACEEQLVRIAAALVALPRHYMRGDFAACEADISAADLRAYLREAGRISSDYYVGMLVEDLLAEVDRRYAE